MVGACSSGRIANCRILEALLTSRCATYGVMSRLAHRKYDWYTVKPAFDRLC